MTEPRYIKDAPLALRAAERDRRRKMEEQVTQWGTDTSPAPIEADAERAAFDRWLGADLPAGCVSDMERGWMARAALASAAQPAPDANVAAWMTPEGDRVVTEVTMAGARKDGGAILSSLRSYSVPLVRAGAAQPAVPSGYALVPVKPTDDMLRGIRKQRSGGRIGKGDRADWAAWLAAAPKAAPTQQDGAAYAALPLAITSAPPRIYLDLGFNPWEEDAHFSNLHDLTWSADNATGDGIEYLRADLASRGQAPAGAAHAAEAELQDTIRRLDSKELVAWVDRGMALAENLAMYVQAGCTLRESQARGILRAHLFSAQPSPQAQLAPTAQPAPAPAAVAPQDPPMPETWHVDVHVHGEKILSIGYDWLSGKGDLTESEEQAVVGMAQHLLSFVGYGLPQSGFDPDADEQAPAAQGDAAPCKVPALPKPDFHAGARGYYSKSQMIAYGKACRKAARAAKEGA